MIEQLHNLDKLEATDERLPALHLLSKIARVSASIFQIVLRVRILIKANRDDVRSAFALECLRARKHKRRVFALHVMVIEAVRNEPIWTSRNRDLFFERNNR